MKKLLATIRTAVLRWLGIEELRSQIAAVQAAVGATVTSAELRTEFSKFRTAPATPAVSGYTPAVYSWEDVQKIALGQMLASKPKEEEN